MIGRICEFERAAKAALDGFRDEIKTKKPRKSHIITKDDDDEYEESATSPAISKTVDAAIRIAAENIKID